MSDALFCLVLRSFDSSDSLFPLMLGIIRSGPLYFCAIKLSVSFGGSLVAVEDVSVASDEWIVSSDAWFRIV